MSNKKYTKMKKFYTVVKELLGAFIWITFVWFIVLSVILLCRAYNLV